MPPASASSTPGQRVPDSAAAGSGLALAGTAMVRPQPEQLTTRPAARGETGTRRRQRGQTVTWGTEPLS